MDRTTLESRSTEKVFGSREELSGHWSWTFWVGFGLDQSEGHEDSNLVLLFTVIYLFQNSHFAYEVLLLATSHLCHSFQYARLPPIASLWGLPKNVIRLDTSHLSPPNTKIQIQSTLQS
jgi:hypothetical protein